MWEHCDLLARLKNEEGLDSFTYRHRIRPRGLRRTPQVLCQVDVYSPTDHVCNCYKDLRFIPEVFFKLPAAGPQRVLRYTAYASLKDIKAFHRSIQRYHGLTEEEIERELSDVIIHADGVQESVSGQRNLMILSIRFGGGNIYFWRIIHASMGDDLAKPNAEEILK